MSDHSSTEASSQPHQPPPLSMTSSSSLLESSILKAAAAASSTTSSTSSSSSSSSSSSTSTLKKLLIVAQQIGSGFLAALLSFKIQGKVFFAWRQSTRIHQCVSRVLKLAFIGMGFELLAHLLLLYGFYWGQLSSNLSIFWAVFWTFPTSLLHTMLTSFWMKDLPVPQAKGMASSASEESGNVARQIAKLVFYSCLPLLLPVMGVLFQLIPFVGSFTAPIVNSYIIAFYTIDTLFTRRLESQRRSRWVECRWSFLVGMALPGCLIAKFLPYLFSVILTNCWWLYLTLLLYCDSSIVPEAPFRLPVFRYTTTFLDWIILTFWKQRAGITTNPFSATSAPKKTQ